MGPGGAVGKESACSVQETQEAQVWSLGWEDHLLEEIAAHSTTLAWEILWTEEPTDTVLGVTESDMTEHVHMSGFIVLFRDKVVYEPPMKII